jgi:hypothetical protein
MSLPQIGTEERAVYELVRHGHVDQVTAGLYREPLRRLEARQLVLRRPDGGFAARLTSDAPPAPESVRPDAMVTLVVRVPAEVKQSLEALAAEHGDLSKATRAVLGRGLSAASGARRKAVA